MNASHMIVRLNRVDLLTLSGVISSSLAVLSGLHGQVYLGIALLFLAMLGDALDGMLARKFGLERAFGRYLDGFMDVLIYLVSPALLFWQLGFDGAYGMLLWLMLICGCVRLSVFNDIGNIQESDGLAYLGMPVFWSVFLLAGYAALLLVVPQTLLNPLLAITLAAFAYAMLLRRPFFKFKSLKQILFITLGGSGLFLLLQFGG